MCDELLTEALTTALKAFPKESPSGVNCGLALDRAMSLVAEGKFVDLGSKWRVLDVLEEATEAADALSFLVEDLWDLRGKIWAIEVDE
jgi:hypothetical protein